ncbi:MAG: GGDEF domain-containing protein [Alphaproteobacteria bacterium]
MTATEMLVADLPDPAAQIPSSKSLLALYRPEPATDGTMRRLLVHALAALDAMERKVARQDAEIERLGALSRTDAVTGLLNRRGFDESLDRALAHARRHGVTGAVMLIDLDGFKAINDTHGHAAGDMILQHVAMLLAGEVRSEDHVARIGGDEFAIVMPHHDTVAAQKRSDAIALRLARLTVPWNGAMIGVHGSVGFAVYGADSAANDVRDEADRRMYAVKPRSIRRSTP